MEFSWFTFIAQIVNFLILVGILKYFLYEPITGAMQDRQDRIKGRMDEAEEKREQADRREREFHKKKEELEETRADFLEQAEEEARDKKAKLIEQAREEVRERREKWEEELLREQRNFLNEFSREVGEYVINTSQRVVEDLSGEEIYHRIQQRFLEKLRDISTDRVEQILESVREGEPSVVVKSSEPLDSEVRNETEKILLEKFGELEEIEYQTESDLICGMEVDLESWSVGWNVRDYLEGIEEKLSEHLEKELGEALSSIGSRSRIRVGEEES